MEANQHEQPIEHQEPIMEENTNPEQEPNENEPNEVEKLQLELKEKDLKYLYLLAEFDNLKRRVAKERIEWNQTAGKEVIIALLEVMDDCDRAEKQIKQNEDAVKFSEGTFLVFNKLRAILQQKGLKAMDSIGTTFDVEKHEAITEIPAPEDMQGKVIDEMEKGYYLNEKLIRFAKVVVGK
jgi:molecular chaperone GrpE